MITYKTHCKHCGATQTIKSTLLVPTKQVSCRFCGKTYDAHRSEKPMTDGSYQLIGTKPKPAGNQWRCKGCDVRCTIGMESQDYPWQKLCLVEGEIKNYVDWQRIT